MQAQARVVQPLGERRHRGRVVVIEVGSRGVHLDHVEAMRGHLDEVLAVEALFVEQVGGDAEARGQTSILT